MIEKHKLSPEEEELFRRCDEVLHYLWDPIGISGKPGARDEYDSYTAHAFALILKNADATEVVEYLDRIVREQMELTPSHERAQEAVNAMIAWRHWLIRG